MSDAMSANLESAYSDTDNIDAMSSPSSFSATIDAISAIPSQRFFFVTIVLLRNHPRPHVTSGSSHPHRQADVCMEQSTRRVYGNTHAFGWASSQGCAFPIVLNQFLLLFLLL
jgi:hypothetical protein